jgi:hypothetical protein
VREGEGEGEDVGIRVCVYVGVCSVVQLAL